MTASGVFWARTGRATAWRRGMALSRLLPRRRRATSLDTTKGHCVVKTAFLSLFYQNVWSWLLEISASEMAVWQRVKGGIASCCSEVCSSGFTKRTASAGNQVSR